MMLLMRKVMRNSLGKSITKPSVLQVCKRGEYPRVPSKSDRIHTPGQYPRHNTHNTQSPKAQFIPNRSRNVPITKRNGMYYYLPYTAGYICFSSKTNMSTPHEHVFHQVSCSRSRSSKLSAGKDGYASWRGIPPTFHAADCYSGIAFFFPSFFL